MKTFKGLLLGIIALFIVISLVFAQDEATPSAATEPGLNNSDMQWVWGEVVNIDTQNKTMVIRYLDYEADQEKEITIGADDKTTYEGIKFLDEIKPKDVLSIDYINAQDGKSIAKNISLEKPEVAISPQGEAELKVEEPVGRSVESNEADQ